MPVDNSAAESARSLLNGIDYSALIGGPLQAAITAQAMAANSTWEFIQQVGLNKEVDGTRSAINVEFMYQSGGEMVRLVVPILVIVPIPLIVVDEITIDFTANINASASSTSENSSAQDVAGSLSASGSVGWGPFSLNANISASYSSKQSSKATSDSRYSVEYTQNVRVHARQADVPAGLATVLNILSSAATGGTLDGQLSVSPTTFNLSMVDPQQKQAVQITTRNGSGLFVSTPVTISVPTTPTDYSKSFVFVDTVTGDTLPWQPGTDVATITRTTNKKGTLGLNLSLNGTAVPTGASPRLTFSAKIDEKGDAQNEIVRVDVAQPAIPASLVFAPTSLPLSGTTAGTASLSGPLGRAVTFTAPEKFRITPASGFLIDASPMTITVTPLDGATAPADPVVFTAPGATAGSPQLSASLTITYTAADLDTDRASAASISVVRTASGRAGLSRSDGEQSQSYTVALQDRDGVGLRVPVRVTYDQGSIAARSDGDRVRSGGRLETDDDGTVQIAFELLPDAEPGESQVIFEAEAGGRPLRRVLRIPIS